MRRMCWGIPNNVSRKPIASLRGARWCLMPCLFLLAFSASAEPVTVAVPATVRGANVAQPDSDRLERISAAVQSFFPESLAAESEADFKAGGPEPSRFFDFVEADLDGIGQKDYVVAAYTNGFEAAVRVLRLNSGSAVLVNEPHVPFMGGIFPTIRLVDLDSDGRPEIMVEFSTPTGHNLPTWVFKWVDHALRSIGPVNQGTLLLATSAVDFDGDGVFELVSNGEIAGLDDFSKHHSMAVYKSKDGVYGPAGFFLDFLRGYNRGRGAPIVKVAKFTASAPDSSYLLRAVNGDGGGRVASATITINGAVVVGPEALNQNVGSLSVPIAVLPENTIEVRLSGAPGGSLKIAIGPE